MPPTTYADPHGGFEMFSVWALPNRPDSGRYVPYDNAKVMCCASFTPAPVKTVCAGATPHLLLVPDQQDAWDQF